ncbi:MAG: DUF1329 domain-containing protein [Pseudomonadales bacterium]|nr:DUF1329 domain-containing protein [Pseudomonadales bacterium]
MKRLFTTALCASVMTISMSAAAKVSPEEAARLGKDLTVTGAEKAGNAEGTIPAFTGEVPVFSKEITDNPTAHLPNPYADEKPLFVITAENVEQHADKLSEGMKAMFKKYPQTYKMPIYKTHRNGTFRDFVNENSIINATSAELVGGGNGVINAFGASPFPIPKNGAEVMWNNGLRPGPRSYIVTYDQAAIYKSGKPTMGKSRTRVYAPGQDEESTREEFAKKAMVGYQLVEQLAPKRKRGEIILVHEPLDQVATPRGAWTYSPASRRVRRAPVVAYDSPAGPGNLITVDDGRMFNGALDRYEWKLVGKKELYIPYNNYDLDNPELDYDQVLGEDHLNPDLMRYELHRVWEVEANLKEGANHVYAKRTFYLDEDTWFIQLADNYDARGNLWRTNMATMVYNPNLPGPYARAWTYNDLISDVYAVERLLNEQETYDDLSMEVLPLDVFTPSGIRMFSRQ